VVFTSRANQEDATMSELKTFPVGDEAKAIMASVPGVRFTHGMVVGFDGPGGHGPEKAGALTVLHMTAVEEEATQVFYKKTNALKKLLQEAPGFIRMFSLFDGLSGYAIAFWRSPEDALAFSRGAAHQQTARNFHERPFQYSHFVGVWSAHTIRPRTIYCEKCHTGTEAPAEACRECRNALVDVFQAQNRALP
jgi:heme-degrading monooxygenase HmoA